MRMNLSEKGPIAPPPILNGPLQGVSETIQSWNAVNGATHWHLFRSTQVDGADSMSAKRNWAIFIWTARYIWRPRWRCDRRWSCAGSRSHSPIPVTKTGCRARSEGQAQPTLRFGCSA